MNLVMDISDKIYVSITETIAVGSPKEFRTILPSSDLPGWKNELVGNPRPRSVMAAS